MGNEKYSNALKENPEESAVIQDVAAEYKLDAKQTRLLYAIRKAENGRVGREFGVLTPEAMRYKDNPEMSFITQARWAAGTIKKRYKGDLNAFANRWAPVGAENDPTGLNKNWVKNVQYWMGGGE